MQSATVKPYPDYHDDNNGKKLEKWKKYARYVCYADVAVAAAAFLQILVIFILSFVYTHQSVSKQEEGNGTRWGDAEFKFKNINEKRADAMVVWLLCVIKIMIHTGGLWMSRQLYSTTYSLFLTSGTTHEANQWRIYQVLKMIFEFIFGVATSLKGVSVGTLSFLVCVLGVGFILIVSKFIKEMEKSVEDGGGARQVRIVAEPVISVAPY